MKLVNKLDDTNDNSLYSGKTNSNFEMYLRPVPSVDADGNAIKPSKRYYVLRLLNFQTDERRYPFIVRHEHEYFRKDASGKVLDVKRILCPTTPWAQDKFNEKVTRDFCPICKMSNEQYTAGWKDFKTTGQRDDVSLQISHDSAARWAAYLAVLVVSDPTYERNNNHLRVLRLSAPLRPRRNDNVEGKKAFAKILECIREANEKNINVFNGGEGANIAILCEKKKVPFLDKNNNEIIDPKTGEPRTREVNCITDVRLLSNRLHSYPSITEEAIERLNFDENYGTVATKDALAAFMNDNYLDNGASDADFGEDFNDGDFSEPVSKPSQPSAKVTTEKPSYELDDSDVFESEDTPKKESATAATGGFTAADLDDDDVDESPSETIARITKKATTVKMESKAELPHDTDALRSSSTSFDEDDLPF